eukprot:scaffold2691_cov417-Prasinococcus_capsulatus_cf.AAC.1
MSVVLPPGVLGRCLEMQVAGRSKGAKPASRVQNVWVPVSLRDSRRKFHSQAQASLGEARSSSDSAAMKLLLLWEGQSKLPLTRARAPEPSYVPSC